MQATLTGEPYPIKAWILCGRNVLESILRRERTLAAIGQLELLAAVDILPVRQT